MADQMKESGWISRFPRVAFEGEVVAVRGDGQAAPLTGANLSETGMLLSLPNLTEPTPAVGENLRLIFELPRLESALQVEARVVRRDELRAELLLGVQFENLAPSARRSLRTYTFTGQGKVLEYSNWDSEGDN